MESCLSSWQKVEDQVVEYEESVEVANDMLLSFGLCDISSFDLQTTKDDRQYHVDK